jgi:flagellar biosynthetic protein FliR
MDGTYTNWLLVFVRAGAFLSILPLFTMLNVPVRVRVAFAALVATLVAPTLPALPVEGLSVFDWMALFTRETLCGLAIGFVTRMVFFATDFAGQLMANEMGLNVASLFDPINSHPTQATSLAMFLMTCILMMSMDMHHWLLTGFQYTYTLAPIGSTRMSEALMANIIEHTGRIFLVGVQLAGPLMAASFLAMLLLAFLGRLIPQMNVFAESFGIRILCGMVLFALTLEISAQHIINGLRRLPDDMLRVAQLLGAG